MDATFSIVWRGLSGETGLRPARTASASGLTDAMKGLRSEKAANRIRCGWVSRSIFADVSLAIARTTGWANVR